MVITRQRPGTAKGFVFLTLEDETGISNIIIRPDLFDRERMAVVRQPFLIVDGVLQHQDGVLSVRAERVEGIEGMPQSTLTISINSAAVGRVLFSGPGGSCSEPPGRSKKIFRRV